MAVKEQMELTDEQKASEEGQRGEAESKTMKRIQENTLDGLDLSSVESIRNKKGDAPPKEKPEDESESTEETEDEGAEEETKDESTEEDDDTSETEASDDESESEDESEDEEEDEEGDEELVPKSKVHKRISSLNARLKALEEENARLKGTKETEAEKDPDTVKLNSMTLEGLKATKREVVVALKKEDDEDKIRKLIDLEDKVNNAINSFGDRFVGRQVDEYNKVAQRITSLGEVEMTKENASKLKAIASDIYNSNPDLKTLTRGQAMALELAYKHFRAISSTKAGKEKVDELKRANNSLKRKTSLDSAGLKGKGKDANLGKLRAKAFRGGDTSDRLALIKADPSFNIENLIPDEYK
jgi:hypothetical protein